jgi:hypothetical protein
MRNAIVLGAGYRGLTDKMTAAINAAEADANAALPSGNLSRVQADARTMRGALEQYRYGLTRLPVPASFEADLRGFITAVSDEERQPM